MPENQNDLTDTVTQLLLNEEALSEIMDDPSLSLECEMLKKVQESLLEHLRHHVNQDISTLKVRVGKLSGKALESCDQIQNIWEMISTPTRTAQSLRGRVRAL